MLSNSWLWSHRPACFATSADKIATNRILEEICCEQNGFYHPSLAAPGMGGVGIRRWLPPIPDHSNTNIYRRGTLCRRPRSTGYFHPFTVCTHCFTCLYAHHGRRSGDAGHILKGQGSCRISGKEENGCNTGQDRHFPQFHDVLLLHGRQGYNLTKACCQLYN
jgi:hypothetical protein